MAPSGAGTRSRLPRSSRTSPRARGAARRRRPHARPRCGGEANGPFDRPSPARSAGASGIRSADADRAGRHGRGLRGTSPARRPPPRDQVPASRPRPRRRALRRFNREGLILDRLDHPGIVRLVARGTHHGLPYLALELVEDGVPIDRYVARSRLALGEILAMTHAIAESIAHAHAKGFVHRDLKPANVLVDRDGRTRLLDFGIAKVEHRELEATVLHTGAEQVLGSLEAMSPEQTRAVHAPVDARSDIYQLGLILHRLAAPNSLPSSGHAAALARLRAIARSVRVARIDGDPLLAPASTRAACGVALPSRGPLPANERLRDGSAPDPRWPIPPSRCAGRVGSCGRSHAAPARWFASTLVTIGADSSQGVMGSAATSRFL